MLGLPILPPSPCLNITFVSLMGKICLGVASTPEAMASPGRYIELLLESVDRLEQALLPTKGTVSRPVAKRRTPTKSQQQRPAAKKTAAKKTDVRERATRKVAAKKTPAKTARRKAQSPSRPKTRAVAKSRPSDS